MSKLHEISIFSPDESPTLIKQHFEEHGYCIFTDLLGEDDLDRINRELMGYFRPLAAQALESARDREDRKQFHCDVIAWDPVTEGNEEFLRLQHHPTLHQMTKNILGECYSAPKSLVMYSVGGGQGQAWHQDCPSDDETAYNVNRLIYTQDVSLDDGALVFVPGSHMHGRIPPGGHQEPIEGEVVLTPKAGTVAFLHGHVFHRVTPNKNEKPRVSVNIRAYPAGIDPDVNCIGVYRNGDVNFCDKPKHHDGTPAARM